MDIYQRFLSLPRARKGTTTVVIVEETVLAELIAAAQTSEALLFGARTAQVGGTIQIGSGPVTGAVLNVTSPPPPGPAAILVEIERQRHPQRGLRGW